MEISKIKQCLSITTVLRHYNLQPRPAPLFEMSLPWRPGSQSGPATITRTDLIYRWWREALANKPIHKNTHLYFSH